MADRARGPYHLPRTSRARRPGCRDRAPPGPQERLRCRVPPSGPASRGGAVEVRRPLVEKRDRDRVSSAPRRVGDVNTRDASQTASDPSPLAPDSSVAVYVHIPWCASLCPYCDFDKQASDFRLVDAYIDALIQHVEATPARTSHSLYFGG